MCGTGSASVSALLYKPEASAFGSNPYCSVNRHFETDIPIACSRQHVLTPSIIAVKIRVGLQPRLDRK
jgi:hypothetical protein